MGQISQQQYPINLNRHEHIPYFLTSTEREPHHLDGGRSNTSARTKTMSEDRFVNEAKTTSEDQFVNEAGTSRCKKQLLQLTGSALNHMVTEKSSRNEEDVHQRRKAEIKQLEGRLTVLEEEVEMLKGALLEGVEERTKMMHDIREDFKTIQHCLLQRQLERGKLYGLGVQIALLSKDRKAGLLQVLCQESNPSLVSRGLRANAVG